MTYISSASYAGEIGAIRLMTMDTYQANDFKLHTLKRRFLLSMIGEVSNEIDRLEIELVKCVENKLAGLAKHSDIAKYNDKLTHHTERRRNILRGLQHEDHYLAKFGENKPFIESKAFFAQLQKRIDYEVTVDDLILGRKYTLSKIGEVTNVIHHIERLLILAIQQNDAERKAQLIADLNHYCDKRTCAFEQLSNLDKRIIETKK